MRTVRNAGITEYLVDLKLCTGNEDTPVVVEDVNADEGAGGSSDEKGIIYICTHAAVFFY